LGISCASKGCDAEGTGLARDVATALVHNSTLTCLDLQHCFIGDDGATHLAAALARNTRLQYLCLEHNNVFRAGTLAIGHALKHSPLCNIGWNTMIDLTGIYVEECSLGKLWKELGLPPIARANNWTDLAEIFFRRVRSQQDQDTERRLAFAMGLHPRLGSISVARMLDHSLVEFIHQLATSGLGLVAMHKMQQAKRDEHDSVARFYEAYDAALHADRRCSNGLSLEAWAISDVPATAADSWQQVVAMATQIVATAHTLRASCEQPVAVDLYEKLHFALQRLGLVERIKELEGAWHATFALTWRDRHEDAERDRHEYHNGFCKVCFQVEDDRVCSWGYVTRKNGSKHMLTQSESAELHEDEWLGW